MNHFSKQGFELHFTQQTLDRHIAWLTTQCKQVVRELVKSGYGARVFVQIIMVHSCLYHHHLPRDTAIYLLLDLSITALYGNLDKRPEYNENNK